MVLYFVRDIVMYRVSQIHCAHVVDDEYVQRDRVYFSYVTYNQCRKWIQFTEWGGFHYIYIYIYIYILSCARYCFPVLFSKHVSQVQILPSRCFQTPSVTVFCIQSNSDTRLSLSSHKNVWAEILCFTTYRFTVTLDKPPQIPVNKQGRYIVAWLCVVIMLVPYVYFVPLLQMHFAVAKPHRISHCAVRTFSSLISLDVFHIKHILEKKL